MQAIRCALVVMIAGCWTPSGTPTPATPSVPPAAKSPPPKPEPTMLALGAGHSCLLERGVVWCWGKNDHGQLGDGTYVSSPRPVRVVGLASAIAITAGEDHTCAIARDRNVWCWGKADRGQLMLGMGTPLLKRSNKPPPSSPRPFEVGLEAVDIAAGSEHTCARLASGEVACWGSDSRGELGGAELEKTNRVPKVTDAIAIRVGRRTSCVLHADRRVTCWGYQNYPSRRTTPPTEVGELAGVTDLAVGAHETCGVRDDEVVCLQHGNPIVTTVALDDVTAIVAGADRICARLGNASVGCWDSFGSFRHRAPKVEPVAELADVRHLAAGAYHACALTGAGQIQCWGDDKFGQLGRGNSNGRIATPTRVSALDDARDLAIGMNHGCALRANGQVSCWPAHYRGEFIDVAAFSGAAAVSSGYHETCARTAGGALACIGSHDLDGRPSTVTVPAGSDGLVVGSAGICVRTKQRELACADEVLSMRAAPARSVAPIAGLTGVTEFASGFFQVCAATSAGLACTSEDFKKATKPASWRTPELVAGIASADVVAIAVGSGHACALLRSGSITCWGDGKDGQLGNGTREYGNRAVTVNAIDDAVEITAGDAHTCVRRKDGSVWCWGSDDGGQLGDGDAIFRPHAEPRRVTSLSNVVEIDAGRSHTCARTTAGTYCWGSNEHGRLGLGVVPKSETPVVVERR